MPGRPDDDSDEESITEEEGPPSPRYPAAMPKVPPAPPAASRARGASVAPVAVRGRRKGDAESSDSVSEAPARRHVPDRFDSDVSSSPPKPGPSRPASPERKAFGGWWRPMGRHKSWGTQDCPICWNEVGNSNSALDQHQRTSLTCLQWQRYNRGGLSWNEALQSAVRCKARR